MAPEKLNAESPEKLLNELARLLLRFMPAPFDQDTHSCMDLDTSSKEPW